MDTFIIMIAGFSFFSALLHYLSWEEVHATNSILKSLLERDREEHRYLRAGLDNALLILDDRQLEEWNSRTEDYLRSNV